MLWRPLRVRSLYGTLYFNRNESSSCGSRYYSSKAVFFPSSSGSHSDIYGTRVDAQRSLVIITSLIGRVPGFKLAKGHPLVQGRERIQGTNWGR